jgi:hypothetical protein
MYMPTHLVSKKDLNLSEAEKRELFRNTNNRLMTNSNAPGQTHGPFSSDKYSSVVRKNNHIIKNS